MMVVAVTTEPTFRPQTPRILFEKASTTTPWNNDVAQYDISPDGQRFLMLEPVEPVDVTEITLIKNWFQELKRLAPIANLASDPAAHFDSDRPAVIPNPSGGYSWNYPGDNSFKRARPL